jgi:site-specific recombinase XerD
MKRTSPNLAPLIEGFFIDYLMTQKRVSNETISSYRDTFRLILRYAQREIGKSPSALGLEDLDATFICAFLNQLEQERRNSPRTRNYRLAAIRSFYRYAAFREPQRSGHIQRVLSIPSKRYQKRMIDFLTVPEVDAILQAIDRKSRLGRRDYALLSLALHTGLRVSELIHLRRDDFTPGPGASILCHGKGRKERRMPVGEIEKTITEWLKEAGRESSQPLFPNRQGKELSRDGVHHILNKYVEIAKQICPSLTKKRVTPHVLRHTTAVHLLQAGVSLPVIALWLGHESPETTQVYLDCDMAHKQKILEKTIGLDGDQQVFRPDDELMSFLQRL